MISAASVVVPYREPSSGAASSESDPSEDAGRAQVYLALRSPKLEFFGGYWAFPGGRLDDGDAVIPRRDVQPVDSAVEGELLSCAARELFEETGVPLWVDGRGNRPMESSGLEEFRRDLLESKQPGALFAERLERRGGAVDSSRLRFLTRLETPPFSRIRFDASFFLVRMDEEPDIWPGEFVKGRWFEIATALELWRQGELPIAAPVVSILRELSAGPLEDAMARLARLPREFEGSGGSIVYAPGYELIPLTSSPLPPSLPTTVFLVGGADFIIVDPSPSGEVGKRHVVEAVERRIEQGHRPLAIVLTHHHPDHVGAVDVIRQRFDLPLWMHRRSAERLELTADRELVDGDRIQLGQSLDGRDGWELEALFTPGHADGHIALYDERHSAIVAGDLVSTLVSMYVGSPGGDLDDYFRSLARIHSLAPAILYPSHGTPTWKVQDLIDSTLQHRKRRIEEILGRVRAEPRSVNEIARETYPAMQERYAQLVRRTTRAALKYLVARGQVEEIEPDVYRIGASTA